MFITLTQVPNIAKTTIKITFKKTSGSSSTKFVFIHAFHTLFHGWQPLIHETAGLFPVKIEKYIVKQRNTSLQNENIYFFSASLYSRTRITSKTVHHIMEDNFALRYVFKHPGVNSRAELVPSHGASRRLLGDKNWSLSVECNELKKTAYNFC
jgi:hypothetical protein